MSRLAIYVGNIDLIDTRPGETLAFADRIETARLGAKGRLNPARATLCDKRVGVVRGRFRSKPGNERAKTEAGIDVNRRGRIDRCENASDMTRPTTHSEPTPTC